MTRLAIDFSTLGRRRTMWRASWVTWLFLMGGLVVAGILTARLRDQFGAMTVLDHVRMDLGAQLARQSAARPVSVSWAISGEQARAVNSAVNALNLPWRDVFDNVEVATPETVALLSLEPDANAHVVELLAETKDTDAMLDYVERLKMQPFFKRVLLTKYETNSQDANRPIRFELHAEWGESLR